MNSQWPTTDIMTASHAAQILGVWPVSIRRAIDRGQIEGYRSGKIWLVKTASARQFKKTGHRPREKARRPERSRKMKEAAANS
jgi:hypothetical protein